MDYRKGIETLLTSSGESIEVKKGKFGYRIVQPIKSVEGKTIWINFLVGGYVNLFKIIFYLVLIGIIYLGFHDIIQQCEVIMNSCNNTILFP